MTPWPLTKHHLEFLSLKRGRTGSSKSTLVKKPHCLKSHVANNLLFCRASGHPLQNVNKDCTRADLSSLSASITWESISCYQVEADFGVCEYYITPINQHKHISLSGRYVLGTIKGICY